MKKSILETALVCNVCAKKILGCLYEEETNEIKAGRMSLHRFHHDIDSDPRAYTRCECCGKQVSLSLTKYSGLVDTRIEVIRCDIDKPDVYFCHICGEEHSRDELVEKCGYLLCKKCSSKSSSSKLNEPIDLSVEEALDEDALLERERTAWRKTRFLCAERGSDESAKSYMDQYEENAVLWPEVVISRKVVSKREIGAFTDVLSPREYRECEIEARRRFFFDCECCGKAVTRLEHTEPPMYSRACEKSVYVRDSSRENYYKYTLFDDVFMPWDLNPLKEKGFIRSNKITLHFNNGETRNYCRKCAEDAGFIPATKNPTDA